MVSQSNVETHKPFPKPLRERVLSTTKQSHRQSHHHGNVEVNNGQCTVDTHTHVSEGCLTAKTHTGHHMILETTQGTKNHKNKQSDQRGKDVSHNQGNHRVWEKQREPHQRGNGVSRRKSHCFHPPLCLVGTQQTHNMVRDKNR